MGKRFRLSGLAFIACVWSMAAMAASAGEAGWATYSGDEGAKHYSSATQLTPSNVDDLIPAWTFHTGHMAGRSAQAIARSKLQTTPILFADRLVMCSPFNDLLAIDPATGRELWRVDPKIPEHVNGTICRGVAAWTDAAAAADAACRQRILMATNDTRIIAVDARSGRACEQFGNSGEIKVTSETSLLWSGEIQFTSPPVVIGNVVVVGSSIGDNARVAAPHGTVRAFDVRTGTPLWTWDPIPRDAKNPDTATWGEGWQSTGHANVWAPMSVDAQRGLIFLPTSSPSPDFFGGLRPGVNRNANSVVALNAATGERKWAYQIVHHDVWDYDVASAPTLATLDLATGKRDVVIQGTKQGFIFVLDRDTGEQVFTVEEQPVPQKGAPGEWLSPTQPIPTHIPALVPQKVSADQAYGLTPWDRGKCRDAIASARNEGLYTPPSEQGTVLFPMTGGGINWGGVAFDPTTQILYANTNRLIHLITLIPADEFAALKKQNPGIEITAQLGAPYGMRREVLVSPLGLPCNPPPWGTLTAVDLRAGKILWESRLGTTEERGPLGLAQKIGIPTLGGSLVTAGGLVFIGSTGDRYLRAFDALSGAELWQGRLPTTTQATPMTYEWQGRQYVVIAAGGRQEAGSGMGDSVVAFALPGPNDAGPTLWSRTVDRPGGRFKLNMLALLALLVGAIWAVRKVRRAIKSRSRPAVS